MNRRKSIVISLGISILLLGVIASTYAYFQAVISNGSSSATSVSAKTIDGLTFSIDGGGISLTATQDNFSSGKGDLTSTIHPYVQLKARNDASTSYNYTLCLNVTQNTFVHSQVGSTDQGLGKSINLFNISVLNDDTYLSVDYDEYIIKLYGSTSLHYTGKKLSELCPDCEAGKTYRFYTENSDTMLYVEGDRWSSDPSANVVGTAYNNQRTLTEDDLNKYVFLYSSDGDVVKPQIILDNILGVTNGTTTVPNYYPYGYIQNPELELTVTDVSTNTTLLTKDITLLKTKICIPTTNGGITTTHTISAAAGKSTIDLYQVSVTLKNYSTSQNINEGKSLIATVDITRVD